MAQGRDFSKVPLKYDKPLQRKIWKMLKQGKTVMQVSSEVKFLAESIVKHVLNKDPERYAAIKKLNKARREKKKLRASGTLVWLERFQELKKEKEEKYANLPESLSSWPGNREGPL